MNTSLLLWLALLGILGLALVLYWPRRFSGPLTEHERRTAHRGLLRRSFALTLITPVTTIAGLLLLVPPLVALDVHGHRSLAKHHDDTRFERSSLWPLAREESTHDWTVAVLCRAFDAAGDEAKLAKAIVEAANDGFHGSCDLGTLAGQFSARDYRNVELSLVALADRAYILTDVVIHAGSRTSDPDPWDVMAGVLETSTGLLDLPPKVHVTGHEPEKGADYILRLARARVRGAPDGPLEVLALVLGDACKTFTGTLLDPRGNRLTGCQLTPAGQCRQDSAVAQRVVAMNVQCEERPLDLDGLLLVADDGETSIVTHDLPISGDWLRDPIDAAANTSSAFVEEMRQHDLRPLRVVPQPADIEVRKGESIVVRSETHTIPAPCHPPLDRGPFSWSGLGPPPIEVAGSSVTIHITPSVLDLGAPEYDPTVFYATLYSITWAANSLHTGRCLELVEPRASTSHMPAHPVLTAQQLDEAAAGLRRGRETIGLVLISLAVLALALGLRRSVV